MNQWRSVCFGISSLSSSFEKFSPRGSANNVAVANADATAADSELMIVDFVRRALLKWVKSESSDGYDFQIKVSVRLSRGVNARLTFVAACFVYRLFTVCCLFLR
jgi:hypothetical protein